MQHLGFTDPTETEGKCSAAVFSPPAVCPYTHYLVKHGLAEKFHEDYASRRPIWVSGDSVLPLHAYHDDFVGRTAVRFLEKVSDESPWHYFVSFVGPHNPWDAPKEYSRIYDLGDMPVNNAIKDPMASAPQDHTQRQEKQRSQDLTDDALAGAMLQYAGMITLVDDYVGRFIDTLRERGMLDNTVIIYCADHGEMMGDHGLFGKSVYFESAVRIPLLVAGPSVAAKGEDDSLVSLSDLAPTILELAGVDPVSPMESSSLVPLLRGEPPDFRDHQISELHNSRMLFDGRYKFIENDGDLDELYGLREDPKEVANLAPDSPKKTEEMRERLRDLLRS
jgi:choline-sulfatase